MRRTRLDPRQDGQSSHRTAARIGVLVERARGFGKGAFSLLEPGRGPLLPGAASNINDAPASRTAPAKDPGILTTDTVDPLESRQLPGGAVYGLLTERSASMRRGANSSERIMSYKLAEAAVACGVNKTTLLRAIKSGKVSATRDAHEQWQIEPAELHRVYPPRTKASTDERSDVHRSEVAVLRERIEDLKTLADELRVWVRDLSEQRDRAEARAAELDKRLLVYQPPASVLPPPRQPWWRRLAS